MKILRILITVALAAAPAGSFAGSIFSGGGVGLWNLNPGGREAGMGILGMAAMDSGAVGGLNPAVWAATNITRFSGGASVQRYYSRDTFSDDISDDFSLKFVALGVSLKPGWTLGFRFHPQTRVDFRIKSSGQAGGNSYENLTIRKGGLSIGSAVLAGRITSNLWLGAAADFIFGTYNDYWRIDFTSIPDAEFRLVEQFFAVRPSIGALYRLGGKMSAGFMAAPAVEMDVSEEIDYTSSDSLRTADKKFDFPYNLGAGLNFPIRGRLTGAADFLWNGWNQENKVIGSSYRYRESQFLGLGVELAPLDDKLAHFIHRMHYRAGISYRNLYYKTPNNRAVTEISGSIGLGVPLKKNSGRADFAFTLGRRGELGYNEAEEYFIDFSVYINTGEKWFVRKKKY